MTWILFLVLPAAFWYLAARATITRFLWSRYPPSLAVFVDCAACTGFWFGAILAIIGWFFGEGLPVLDPRNPLLILVTGWITMLTTPMIAALHQKAFEVLGTVVDDGVED